MTPLPKRRHSSARGGKREAAIKKKVSSNEKCPKCGHIKLPHRICPNCGYYKDKSFILHKIKKTPKS